MMSRCWDILGKSIRDSVLSDYPGEENNAEYLMEQFIGESWHEFMEDE